MNIAFEIAKVGITGISPKKSYTLKTIPNKTFGVDSIDLNDDCKIKGLRRYDPFGLFADV